MTSNQPRSQLERSSDEVRDTLRRLLRLVARDVVKKLKLRQNAKDKQGRNHRKD